MFLATLRQGIGLDIEYNENVIYRARTEDEDGNEGEELMAFQGIIITLPFIKIHLGDFFILPNYKRVGPVLD